VSLPSPVPTKSVPSVSMTTPPGSFPTGWLQREVPSGATAWTFPSAELAYTVQSAPMVTK
jgi:hypothetical protein